MPFVTQVSNSLYCERVVCYEFLSCQVRSLANYCLKMKFRRPMASQVRKRLQYICEQEGYKSVPVEVVESIANSCNGDIRQMINLLQVRGRTLPEPS